ncbi:hypothetical protein BN1708_003562 [Verticillium longisporum]|uniref:3-oxo-5-alpha-steroid 4-dehydrogenase C-terminal domain-containing protein n=1 Tax=Verticillium longisporum TaxID=100787 RepID=A0A0G4LKP8_VERLO|nr:hypothetical protein BN1708_003562 [Verticillium longisporum]
MSLIENWLPPTRENWKTILTVWQISYPILGSLQYLISWYGMGKTSVKSRINLPGRLAWFLMEIPGFSILLYVMRTLPGLSGVTDLPWQNKVLAGLFVIHYSYRAVIFPFIQPSMSPIHPLVAVLATSFQLVNGTCIGAYLAAYGPTTEAQWSAALAPFGTAQFVAGIAVFYFGLIGNYFHDEELREIRRVEQRRQERVAREKQQNGDARPTVDKHYRVPNTLLFRYMLYPHYLCEWIEWFGFWMASGWSVPARAFLINEIAAMLPRAIKGRKWYAEQFGEDKIRKKWAVLPGLY